MIEPMEGKLRELFDFQQMAQNSALEALIKDVRRRYGLEGYMLSDDELEQVTAAGEPKVLGHLHDDETH